jgi:hypothetical protein
MGTMIMVTQNYAPRVMRLTDSLRYHFVRDKDANTSWIEDAKFPSQRNWVESSVPGTVKSAIGPL